MAPCFPSAIILLAMTWVTLITCFTLALNNLDNLLRHCIVTLLPTDQSPQGQLPEMVDRWRRRHCSPGRPWWGETREQIQCWSSRSDLTQQRGSWCTPPGGQESILRYIKNYYHYYYYYYYYYYYPKSNPPSNPNLQPKSQSFLNK